MKQSSASQIFLKLILESVRLHLKNLTPFKKTATIQRGEGQFELRNSNSNNKRKQTYNIDDMEHKKAKTVFENCIFIICNV